MKNYTLHVNEKQYNVIARALECYSRIGTGQFDIALEEQIYMAQPMFANDIRICCNRLKYLTTGIDGNGSIGISNASESYRTARDIYWAMMNKVETKKHSIYNRDIKTAMCFGPHKMINIKIINK